ncbi:MAG TPA: hypothetical protein VHE37_08525 [Nevskiaceae bacterium]|nr:hypothetical protein [Nevskiaceae bacterium]
MSPGAPGTDDTAPRYHIISGAAAYAQHLRELAAAAHVSMLIFTHDLDQRIYGGEEFIDALKKFILQNRRANLRVIIHSPGLAMRRGHRLVELGRALSSRIEFRELPEQYQSLIEEYAIADQRGGLYKEYYGDLESQWHEHDPLFARERLRAFDTLWPECVPARELRDLRL